MPFERKPNWTDAQWEVMRYWATRPRTKSESVLTQEAIERGKRRRRIERIQDSRERRADFREVWE